jgi:4-amino-4-deoxy-L-arabinose transferase-like glycosyltransferase
MSVLTADGRRRIGDRQRRSVIEVCWWPATIVALLLAALWFDHSGLGRFDASYDSGVYLESARMMRRGYPQYIVVFGSQPPLWLPLLQFSFFLFGESFFSGQLVSAAACLITVGAVMVIMARLQDRFSAIMAALLVVLSPVELSWSRTVIADVPSSAFATVAMALVACYFSVGSRLWLVLTAAAIAVSILIKLFGVYTLPPVLLLVLARWMQTPRLDLSARLYGFSQDLLILGATMAGLIVLATSASGLPKVWDQAVLFHLRARVSAGARERLGIIFNCWPGNGPLQILTALSALCIFGGWRGSALLAWVLCTLLGLLQQRPLFTHHLLALMPASAAAAAFGWGELARRSLNYWNRAENVPVRALASIAGATCLIVGFVVPFKLWTIARRNDYFELAAQTEGTLMDLAVAQELQQLTRPGDSILTDAQGIAFLAYRDVPPGLTDTSFTRIAAKYLSAQQVIDEINRSHVRAALLWTGRLAQMPAVVAWVKAHFPCHHDFGNGRDLYFLPRGQRKSGKPD